MIDLNDIDKAFGYYNMDNKYKNRCYESVNNINNNDLFLTSFNNINDILNYSDFNIIKKLWKYKDVNELFCEGIDPFVTNLIILLSYKNNRENIERSNIDKEQIIINKRRIKECFESDLINRNYESVRISQMLWAYYFARVRIIEVGRLQYQYSVTDDNKKVIKIHIPKGNKLDISSVRKSIDDSKQEIEKIFKVSNCEYICNSWLLSNKLNEIIDKNSNIHKFYKLFDVIDGENCIDDIINFVYQKKEINNYNELQENTNLQQLIKMELLNGTTFKIGKGVLIS